MTTGALASRPGSGSPARPGTGTETGIDVADEKKEELAPLFRVICHDDPVTTMDFVIEVLRGVFRIPHVRAVDLMMEVHTKGAALVGRYPESTAKSKVDRATSLARGRGFPLTFTVEPDD